MKSDACPFDEKKIDFHEGVKANNCLWHGPVFKFYIAMAFIAAAVWVVAMLILSRVEMVGMQISLLLDIFGVFAIFILLAKVYSANIRRKYIYLAEGSKNDGGIKNKIPVHGMTRTLFDIFMRSKVLMRGIDVERMKRYGDIYLMFAGPLPIIVVTSSALAEQISTGHELFSKSDPDDLHMYYYSKWVGSNNVVLANGADWHRIRKITHPALNSVENFLPVFNRMAISLCMEIERLVSSSNKKSGSVVNLSRWLRAVSLDSAGISLFGFDFNNLKEESNAAVDSMGYVISEIFDPARIALPIKNKFPINSNRRLERCMQHLDRLVLDMVANVRGEHHESNRDNVLEMLISSRQADILSADELRNNIIAMVVASYETTQVSLSGVLFFLAKYPDLQEKLRAEAADLFPNLDSAFDGGNSENYRKIRAFHSLGNFILESLRMYSPLANQNLRTTTKDTVLGGYKVPKGSLVSINIHAIHMNPIEWDSPEIFNPGRFYEGHCENKFGYLPFGAGPRVCAGRNFTLTEQKIILCHILRKFHIELPDEKYEIPIKRASFTGVPDETFRLRFKVVSI